MSAALQLLPAKNPGVPTSEGERDRLLAMVAHEVHTPLTPIINGALVLQRRDLDPELARATARIIERQARLLGRLIDDLLDLSRAQNGPVQLQRRRVSMSAIVESCVDAVTPYLSDRGQRLQVTVAPDSMELHADAARLCQALQNLVMNAGKFSARGAVIRVRAAREHGSAAVVVSDDGMGIEAADLELIFAVCGRITAAGTRSDGGLGVGLYLARRFVEAHAGTLVAASPGLKRGSSFTLRIPCIGFAPEAGGFPYWSPGSRSVSALTTA
jgi:signal transduction histidine kinase